MDDMLKANCSIIEPVYTQLEPNAAMDLGSVSVGFAYEDKTYTEQARVSMRFVPNARLLFIVPGIESLPQEEKLEAIATGLDDWDGKLTLVDRDVTLEALCVGRGGSSEAFTFMPKSSPVIMTPPHDALVECVFHVFNFPEFFGPEDYTITMGQPPHQGWTRCGCVFLKADGWTITIADTDRTRDHCEALSGVMSHNSCKRGGLSQAAMR